MAIKRISNRKAQGFTSTRLAILLLALFLLVVAFIALAKYNGWDFLRNLPTFGPYTPSGSGGSDGGGPSSGSTPESLAAEKTLFELVEAMKNTPDRKMSSYTITNPPNWRLIPYDSGRILCLCPGVENPTQQYTTCKSAGFCYDLTFQVYLKGTYNYCLEKDKFLLDNCLRVSSVPRKVNIINFGANTVAITFEDISKLIPVNVDKGFIVANLVKTEIDLHPIVPWWGNKEVYSINFEPYITRTFAKSESTARTVLVHTTFLYLDEKKDYIDIVYYDDYDGETLKFARIGSDGTIWLWDRGFGLATGRYRYPSNFKLDYAVIYPGEKYLYKSNARLDYSYLKSLIASQTTITSNVDPLAMTSPTNPEEIIKATTYETIQSGTNKITYNP